MNERSMRSRLFSLGLVLTLAAGVAACGDDDSSADSTAPASSMLALAADVVWGPLNIPDDQRAAVVCVNESRFPRNSEIVWRARVTDPATGVELDDTDLTVQVTTGDGQVFDMRYGPHPRENPTDFFWTASFDIPADYPTGTLSYTIAAVAGDGGTGSYVPFNVASSLLTVTEDVLETIAEG